MKHSPCDICLHPKLSLISVLCRICYDNDKDEALIAPCHCKGTVAFVHRSCLERWLAESNTTMCELCHVVFRTERSPKYTSKESIWRWLKSQQTPGGIGRGVRSDIIACTVITPVAIIITYVCLFSSDYYNQKKFMLIPAARWTSVSLLIMIGIMLIGYYLWVYSVIRLHSRMWYNWWQRECVVRYIPPSSTHICSHSCIENINPTNTPVSAESANEDNDDASSRQVDDENRLQRETIEERIESLFAAIPIPSNEDNTVLENRGLIAGSDENRQVTDTEVDERSLEETSLPVIIEIPENENIDESDNKNK